MGTPRHLALLTKTMEMAQKQLTAQQKIYLLLPLACVAAVEAMPAIIPTLIGCHTDNQCVTSTVGEIRWLLLPVPLFQ